MSHFRKYRLLFPAALALAVVAPIAAAQDEPKPKAAATTVPFEMLPSNHMLLTARVNDGEPRQFIFDVGSPVTLLTNKAAEAGKVVDGNAPRIALFGARGDGVVKSFQVGDVVARDMPVMVMDHPAVSALSQLLGKPIDGLVGYTFFAKFKTTIDYQKKELTFEPVDFEVRDLMKTLTEQMRGPRVAQKRILAPAALWGLALAAPEDGARGVPVKEVRLDSPAALAGLKPGDVIATLDGRWTVSVADVYAAAAGVEPGREVEVVVLRDGQEIRLMARPRVGL